MPAACSSPNAARKDKAHYVGLQDLIPYLATPFLAHGTFDDHMNRAPLTSLH